MYPQYQLMKTLRDERLRAAALDHLAAEARRARAAGRDHAAATRAGATASGAATMPRKQGDHGLGIPLGAIFLFPQGIIPAALKLAHAAGRIAVVWHASTDSPTVSTFIDKPRRALPPDHETETDNATARPRNQ